MPDSAIPIALLTEDAAVGTQVQRSSLTFQIDLCGWNRNGPSSDDHHLAVTLAASLAEHGYQAVCVGPDVPEALALGVSRSLDHGHPEIGVVLLRRASPDLWREAARAGVRDIIEPDGSLEELGPALVAAVERGASLRAQSPPQGPRNKLIVVLSPKGGSGKTMVTTNLGIALAASNTGQTVVVDLDCVFGDVASALGMVPEHTIDGLAAVSAFDSTTLKVFLSRHERSGLYVLAGSGRPEDGEAVTEEIAGRALDMLGRSFPYVVVDTAAGLDERALVAIDRATDVILLASMDVTSVRNLGKEIDALDRLGLTTAHRHFLLNRADARVGIELRDVESALGLTVQAALPSSRLVPLSMNQGRTLVLDEPDSPVARALRTFADRFIDIDSLSQPPAQTSRFFMRRR
jgi:pilus assembly protein CpaE